MSELMSESLPTPSFEQDSTQSGIVPEETKLLIYECIEEGYSADHLIAVFGRDTVESVAKTDPDLFDVPGTGPDIYWSLNPKGGN